MKKNKSNVLEELRWAGIIFVILLGLISIVATGCGGGGGSGDDESSSEPELLLGNWFGDRISFSVSEGSYLVTNFSVTFNGHATGTLCSYDYETPLELNTDFNVEDNFFSYEDDQIEIDGEFLDNGTAEVIVSWSTYNPVCDATVTGTHVYLALHVSGHTCTDADSDNFYAESGCGAKVDCNDRDSAINPREAEICDDGQDNDCDGDTDTDDSDCGPGLPCDLEMVYDCVGNCVDEATAWSSVGDGFCDDGTDDRDLRCPEFGNDGGDCDS